MGGKSKSSSANTQQTTNTQNISNETIGVEGNELAVVAGDSSSVQITTTDHGAVDAAADIADSSIGLAGEALQVNADVVESALDFSDDFGGRALDTVDNALGTVERGLDESLDFGAGVVSDSLAFSRDNLTESLDFGKASLEFAQSESEANRTAQGQALSTLSSAITRVADASRSDTTETFRRIVLYGAIALGLVGAVYAYRRG